MARQPFFFTHMATKKKSRVTFQRNREMRIQIRCGRGRYTHKHTHMFLMFVTPFIPYLPVCFPLFFNDVSFFSGGISSAAHVRVCCFPLLHHHTLMFMFIAIIVIVIVSMHFHQPTHLSAAGVITSSSGMEMQTVALDERFIQPCCFPYATPFPRS